MSEIRSLAAIVAAGVPSNGKYVREGKTTAFSVLPMDSVKHVEIQTAAHMQLDPKAITEEPTIADAGQYFFVPPALLYLSGAGFDYQNHPRVPKEGSDVAAKEATRNALLAEVPHIVITYDET